MKMLYQYMLTGPQHHILSKSILCHLETNSKICVQHTQFQYFYFKMSCLVQSVTYRFIVIICEIYKQRPNQT